MLLIAYVQALAESSLKGTEESSILAAIVSRGKGGAIVVIAVGVGAVAEVVAVAGAKWGQHRKLPRGTEG